MIKQRLSVGDVVVYRRSNRISRTGLVWRHNDDGRIYCRWRNSVSKRWEHGRYWISEDDHTLELHPDGAQIWADYCAAVLRGEEEPL